MNNETKHTPGPWIVKSKVTAIVRGQKNEMNFLSVETPAAGGGGVALVSYNAFGKENAQLIAAVPELLECLEAVFKNWKQINDPHFEGPQKKLYDLIAKLLDKANGIS